MSWRPNSVLGFLKTKTSFHGAEIIADKKVYRHFLLYNIRLVETDRERNTVELMRIRAAGSAGPLQRALIEVAVAETVAKGDIAESQVSALASLMVDHRHRMRAPETALILIVVGEGERL